MLALRTLLRLTALALLLATMPALAHPALWVVRRGPATVYLFGTVHLLPDHTAWRFPALQRALAASDALYVEITDDSPVHMQALVLRYGLDPAHPLSPQLDAADRKLLAAAAKAAGLPGGVAALQPMKPWLAALTLTVAPLVRAGMNPAQGVDKQLEAQMHAAGKPVRGLETAAMQIHFLADMSPAMQRRFLHATLKDVGHARAELARLIHAWMAGDVATISRVADGDMRHQAPQLYQRLIAQRNARWTRTIRHLLTRPGTRFVAVGAAHLAGPDSVQTQLARHGLTVQRVH